MDLPNKIDKNPIQHQIDYVRFDFYDPAAVKRISIKPLIDPVAFDNLGTPIRGGLHDVELGVGAYDKIGSCYSCKQSSNDCTGHFGHIELSAILYNPFLLTHLLKLMRNKCFFCHKLRLENKDKIYIFIKIFLIKLGLENEATDLYRIMYTTAMESTKSIENKIRQFLSNFSDKITLIENEDLNEDFSRERHGSVDTTTTDETNNYSVNNISTADASIEKKKSKKKKNLTEEEASAMEQKMKRGQEEFKKGMKDKKNIIIEEIFSKMEVINKNIRKNKNHKIIFNQSLNVNIILKNTISEFWKMAKSGKCPHCEAMNAKIKKVGNIKFFQAPFSKKVLKRMKQSGIDPNKDALEEGGAHRAEKKIKKKKEKIKEKEKENEKKEDKLLIKGNSDVKKKKKLEEEEALMLSSDSESELDENNDDSYKYLHPMEIEEHIKRLWEQDGDLLSIVFGNLIREENDDTKFSFKISSTGYRIFFIESLIVPPNRFRPENKTGGDGVYLHAQTAAYTKLLNLSNELRRLSLRQKEDEEKDKESVKAQSKNENESLTSPQENMKKITMKDLITKWTEMQDTVNILFDSTKAANKKDADKSKGIKQLLEKKQGVYRTKMMGKRVNYAGRSVISPDPNIASSEVGIPLYIAQKLFFTEVVTNYNKDILKKLVRNGNKKYPGASMVINKDGRTISLDIIKEDYRHKLAENLTEGEKVLRHMQTGDILLVNRQPTLHKSSIMSHKARVLPGEKTIRLHYANCNTYNADFDGDEMNIHLMQNHIARQEAYTISNTDNQYIIPTNGKPIRGLIQDSIVSAVFLTMKNSFFTKEEYFQLVYSCLEAPLNCGTIRRMEIQIPAIIKPKVLFTGKQIITTVLKSLITSRLVDHIINDQSIGMNFEHSTKLGDAIWGVENKLEGRVVVRDNELLTGVLDKNHIGNSELGIIHSFYEIYGPEMAGELISTFGRLFINYLQFFHGFTCGVDDILLKDESNLKRRKDIENIIMNGMTCLGKFFEVDNFELNLNNYSRRNVFTRKTAESIAHLKLLPNERKDIERLLELQNINIDKVFDSLENSEEGEDEETEKTIKSFNKIKELKEKYYETVLKDESKTIDANVDTVVKNGINKISSESTKNWLKGLSKNFPKNFFSAMVLSGAKGSLVNHSQITCMLGQQELEGRRVPRMASGRTLPSFEPFDPNPRAGGFVSDRFSTGIRPQEFFFHCMAGREGLIDTAVKTSRSGYLQRCLVKHLEQIIVNYDYTVRDTDGNVIQFLYGEDSIDPLHTKYLNNFQFIANNLATYNDKYRPHRLIGKIDSKTMRKVWQSIEKESDEGRLKEIEKNAILNQYEPWKYLGSISDKIYNKMMNFVSNESNKLFNTEVGSRNRKNSMVEDNLIENKNSNKNDNDNSLVNLNKISKSSFKTIVYVKYLNSLIQPGESVGILAAQSIGEPSTQMTLNTFHLAGHGGANMTLGVPRLREILMTSERNIKTPIMILPILSNNYETVKKLSRNFEKHFLIDIVKQTTINQNILINKNLKFRKYQIGIHTENMDNISSYFDYSYENVIKKFKIEFIPRFAKFISKYIRLSNKKGEILMSQVKIKSKGRNDEENGEEKEEDYESKLLKEDNESEDENDEHEYEDVEGTKGTKKENTEDTFTDQEDKNEDETNEIFTDEEGSKLENIEKENSYLDEDLEKIIKTEEDEESNDDEQEEEKTKKKKDKSTKENEILNNKNFSWEDVKIENMILNIESDSTVFNFDLCIPFTQKNVLLKNMLDHTLRSITFKCVKNVNRCFILDKNENNETKYMLQLEGINFDEILKYSSLIDINKVYTNDVGRILHKYGIEACRSSIVKEIFSVFDSYHIAVDTRHLGLIADYMTNQGDYRSFNRKGLSIASSPFLKMTFESTMEHLISSCISKEVDSGKNSSARIILGQVPQCGTGMFSIMQNLLNQKNLNVKLDN